MPHEQRIIDLERELIETRRAAVSIVVDITDSADRPRMAEGLDRKADASDPAEARLARLIAEALRRD